MQRRQQPAPFCELGNERADGAHGRRGARHLGLILPRVHRRHGAKQLHRLRVQATPLRDGAGYVQ